MKTVEERVRSMKLGNTFQIESEKERQSFFTAVRVLLKAKVIDFRIQTSENKSGGYTANCVPE